MNRYLALNDEALLWLVDRLNGEIKPAQFEPLRTFGNPYLHHIQITAPNVVADGRYIGSLMTLDQLQYPPAPPWAPPNDPHNELSGYLVDSHNHVHTYPWNHLERHEYEGVDADGDDWYDTEWTCRLCGDEVEPD